MDLKHYAKSLIYDKKAVFKGNGPSISYSFPAESYNGLYVESEWSSFNDFLASLPDFTIDFGDGTEVVLNHLELQTEPLIRTHVFTDDAPHIVTYKSDLILGNNLFNQDNSYDFSALNLFNTKKLNINRFNYEMLIGLNSLEFFISYDPPKGTDVSELTSLKKLIFSGFNHSETTLIGMDKLHSLEYIDFSRYIKGYLLTKPEVWDMPNLKYLSLQKGFGGIYSPRHYPDVSKCVSLEVILVNAEGASWDNCAPLSFDITNMPNIKQVDISNSAVYASDILNPLTTTVFSQLTSVKLVNNLWRDGDLDLLEAAKLMNPQCTFISE